MTQYSRRARERRRQKTFRRLTIIGLIIVLSGLLIGAWFDVSRASRAQGPHLSQGSNLDIERSISREILAVRSDIQKLSAQQTKTKADIFDTDDAEQALTTAEIQNQIGDYAAARESLRGIKTEIATWQEELRRSRDLTAAVASTSPSPASSGTAPSGYTQTIPILIYHKTPPNFGKQLDTLIAKGYTTVSLDQVANALATRKPLTGKPIVITFDDGFADQWQAFQALKQRNMKATFYIITGGQASRGCIGADRTNTSCGDSYLSWDQIRQIDASGLVTIGNHTVDHLALAAQPEAVQDFQIRQAKLELENKLGHPVQHFAYPYGSFNAITVKLMRKYGMTTAVSTLPGVQQSPDWIYSLRRTRSVDKLP